MPIRDARTGPRERFRTQDRGLLDPCNIVTIKNGFPLVSKRPDEPAITIRLVHTPGAAVQDESWVSATERGSSCTAWPGHSTRSPTALCKRNKAREGSSNVAARAQTSSSGSPARCVIAPPSASMLARRAMRFVTPAPRACSSASARSSDARAAPPRLVGGVRDATPGSASGRQGSRGGERAGIGGGAARYAGRPRAQRSTCSRARRGPLPVAWPPPPPHPGARSARRTPSGASCPSRVTADQQGLRAPLVTPGDQL